MNWKNTVVVLCSILILVAIGLGVSIIYSDYLYSPTGTLDTLQVMSNTEPGYNSPSASATDAQLFEAIEKWAKEEQATILFKNGLSAGCGFCGFSDWAKQELGIDDYQNDEGGIYVADTPAIQKAYVSGNVLLPGSAGLEIRGTYSSSILPQILTNVDFLYPLSISTTASGMYFTDAKETEKLVALFDSSGYSVVTNRQSNNLTLGQLMKRLVSDSFLSRAVLFAMTGLVFCFVYSVLMLYRDNARKLWVHHLFGLSRKRILLGILLLMAGMVSLATLLFSVVLLNGLTYMSSTDLRSIFSGTLMLYIILTVFVNGMGYYQLSRQFRLRGA
ncbi:MAG: hypothetical protein RR413_09360 [Christensenellaceae bacterium]